jgi:hypothetical protein
MPPRVECVIDASRRNSLPVRCNDRDDAVAGANPFRKKGNSSRSRGTRSAVHNRERIPCGEAGARGTPQ